MFRPTTTLLKQAATLASRPRAVPSLLSTCSPPLVLLSRSHYSTSPQPPIPSSSSSASANPSTSSAASIQTKSAAGVSRDLRPVSLFQNLPEIGISLILISSFFSFPFFQPFTLKAGAVFLATGVALYFYFENEKKALKERKRQENAAARIGRPKIGGPFSLTDQDGRVFTEQDLLGKWSMVYVSFRDLFFSSLISLAGSSSMSLFSYGISLDSQIARISVPKN